MRGRSPGRFSLWVLAQGKAYLGVLGVQKVGATRCRKVECTRALAWSTRHVPAGLYAGVLATRCVVGATPCEQCTELGLNGERKTRRGILPR